MSIPGFDDIPVCESKTEQNEVRSRCAEMEIPVLMITSSEKGYPLSYDMMTTPYNLTDRASEKIEQILRNLRHSQQDIIGHQNEDYAAGLRQGFVNLRLLPIAVEGAEELAQILYDEANWVSRSEF